MKPIFYLGAFLFSTLIVCCVPEDSQIEEKEVFFLTGLINHTDSLKLSSQNASWGYGYDPNPLNGYYKEGPSFMFPLNEQTTEQFEINFRFRFHESNVMHNPPILVEQQELIDMLQVGEWSFYPNLIDERAVGIVLHKIEDGYKSYSNAIYEDDELKNLYNNRISRFEVVSVEKYEDTENRSGIKVEGNFNCVVYSKVDSLILSDMKFKGFIRFPVKDY